MDTDFPAPNDDLIVDPLPVVAHETGLSLSSLRRAIATGRGPIVTHLSLRRRGVQRRHRRAWLDSLTTPPNAA